jgi:hypothetical protein
LRPRPGLLTRYAYARRGTGVKPLVRKPTARLGRRALQRLRFHVGLLEAGGGGGFGVEGGDGFDQARYGESIADAALTADQVETATLAG